MILSFHPCLDADIQIILGDRPVTSGMLQLIGRAKAIILPQGCPTDLYAASSRSSALIFPRYETRFKYPGKIGQHALFQDFSCSHPATMCWSTVKEFTRAYPDHAIFPHELPFLVKQDRSHEAEGIYLVEGKTSLAVALDHLISQEKSGMSGFVTQSYVFSGGNVLRAVIIGKRVITYWKRPHKPGEAITTISRGATIDYNWRRDLQEKGKIQVQALSERTGINLAAIDFVFSFSDKDPEPLFLEINYYFARRGLGGLVNYYHLLFHAIQRWLAEAGLNPDSVRLT